MCARACVCAISSVNNVTLCTRHKLEMFCPVLNKSSSPTQPSPALPWCCVVFVVYVVYVVYVV